MLPGCCPLGHVYNFFDYNIKLYSKENYIYIENHSDEMEKQKKNKQKKMKF